MRIRTITALLAILVLLTGCPVDLVFRASVSQFEQQLRESPCQGAACDRDEWLPIEVLARFVTVHSPLAECTMRYELDFLPQSVPDDWVVSAMPSPTGSLQLAIATWNGRLCLADFGAADPTKCIDFAADGVAWSNAGDRMAVVSRMPETLRIYDEDLNLLDEHPLTLPARGPNESGRRVFVSWSADDTLVLASTDTSIAGVTGESNVGQAPGAYIVRLADGAGRVLAISDAFFIGTDQLVASVPPDGSSDPRRMAGRVHIVTLDGIDIRDQRALPGPLYAVASHPVLGVFATIRRNVPVGFAPLSVGLQTEDIGPDVVSNNYAPGQSSVSLIPLDIATPTLEAAGFGLDDAPQPDPITNACPG